MSIYEYIDPTAEEAKRLFWELVPIVAEQAGVTPDDAMLQMRRIWVDAIRELKPSHGIDHSDGRAAAWRVRLLLWRLGPQGQADLFGDSDEGKAYTDHNVAPGSTIIYGLPGVAQWVHDLCTSAHPPGSVIDGLGLAVLKHKTKSLRVALSNSGGSSAWRINYSVTPAPDLTAPADDSRPHNALRDIVSRGPQLQHFRAIVNVQREEPASGKM